MCDFFGMKSPILVASLSAIVGGAVGSWLTHSWFASAPSTPTARVSADRAQRVDIAEQEPSVGDEALAERLRKLEHRLSLVTAALQKTKDGGSDSQLPGDDGVEGARPAADVADPVFEAAVLDIMDRDRERKEEEKITWQKQLQTERSRRYAGQLTDKLALDSGQQAQIASIVQGHFEQLRALRSEESPEQPTTRNEWRAARDKMNQALDEQLKAVLSAEQYTKYQALDPDDQLGFGRRNRNPAQDAPR